MSGARGWAESILGGTARGNEVVCDCLFCGKAGHMYVNGTTGLSYCFVCGAGANLAQLISELEGVDEDFAAVKAARIVDGGEESKATSESLAAAYIRLLQGRFTDSGELAAVKLPKGCVPIMDNRARAARNYLHSRKFSQQHWHRYNLLFCPEPESMDEKRYRRHVVFPNTDTSGRITFFTTRAAYEPAKGFPKSYHPSGAKRGGILFGEYALRNCVKNGDAPLFIVEGPLDMLALSGFAVALIGKFMSDLQADAAAKYPRVVVALDAGREEDYESTKIAALLKKKGAKHVRICREYAPGVKDAGGMAAFGPVAAAKRLSFGAADYGAAASIRSRLLARP